MTGLLDLLGLISLLATIVFGMLSVSALKKEEPMRKHWRNLGLSFMVMVAIAFLNSAIS